MAKVKKITFKKFLGETVPTIWDSAGIRFTKNWKNIVPNRRNQEEQEEGDQPALSPKRDEEGYDEDRFAPAPQEGDEDFADIANEEDPEVDPNKEGPSIRHVDGAHLVYKRENPQGTFDELWVYKITDGGEEIRNELKIRRDILNGTDILPNKYSSEDGTQKLEIVTIGNAQLLRISGMPN